MKEIAIKVEGLSKKYNLQHALKGENDTDTKELWALNDVSFEIRKGESVGIIGPNGSGKSTLLKILAGVTKPTFGKVEIIGRVASILDIGSGFHPDLSGRENVYLNGQVQGFTKKEIQAKYDEIIEFSGIGSFIEEPVKNYSNGMFLRLAFSIMAHLDFDVYLFDEVFSVGDAAFGLKTRVKFQELLASNKTMIFVSHNVLELKENNNYILIEKGLIKKITSSKEILTDYLESTIKKNVTIHTTSVNISDFSMYEESDFVKVLNIKLYQEDGIGEDFKSDCTFILEVLFEKLQIDKTVDLMLFISDLQGRTLLTSAPFLTGKFELDNDNGGRVVKGICRMFSPLFNIESYSIDICFVKNLSKLSSEYESDIVNLIEDTEENLSNSIYRLSQVITFKPMLKLNGVSFNSNQFIQSGLLLDFNWKLKKNTNKTKSGIDKELINYFSLSDGNYYDFSMIQYLPQFNSKSPLSSASIFIKAFDFFDLQTNLVQDLSLLEKHQGLNTTVWGIRNEGGKYSVEYYFYFKDKYNQNSIDHLLSLLENYTDIKDLKINELNSNYFLISFNPIHQRINGFNFYDVNFSYELPYFEIPNTKYLVNFEAASTQYSYFYDFDKRIVIPKNTYHIFKDLESLKDKIDKYSEELYKDISNFISKEIFSFPYVKDLLKNSIKYKNEIICVVSIKDEKYIGLYFTGLNFLIFIKFLTFHGYPDSFTSYLVENESQLSHLRHDVVVDVYLDGNELKIRKTAFFGTI